MHKYHEGEDRKQVKRIQGNAYMVGDQTEQRRHDAGAGISACHLDADQSLRTVSAEVLRCGVDDARVDGRASEPDRDQSCQSGGFSKRQEQKNDAQHDQSLTEPYHLRIVQPECQKAADGPSGCDTDIKERSKLCGSFGVDAVVQHEVAACPEPCRRFKRAVAEKGCHDGDGSGDLDNMFQCKRSSSPSFGRIVTGGSRTVCFFCVLSLLCSVQLPKREAEKKNCGQNDLEQGDIAVAHRPSLF